MDIGEAKKEVSVLPEPLVGIVDSYIPDKILISTKLYNYLLDILVDNILRDSDKKINTTLEYIINEFNDFDLFDEIINTLFNTYNMKDNFKDIILNITPKTWLDKLKKKYDI